MGYGCYVPRSIATLTERRRACLVTHRPAGSSFFSDNSERFGKASLTRIVATYGMAHLIPGLLLVSALTGTGSAAWALTQDFSWAGVFAAYVMGGELGLIACTTGYLSGARSKRTAGRVQTHVCVEEEKRN